MNNADNKRYTYQDAGFNRFFKRSIGSSPDTVNLQSVSGPNRQLNFDDVQVSGSIGDVLRLGKINLDGKKGNLSFYDDRDEAVATMGFED